MWRLPDDHSAPIITAAEQIRSALLARQIELPPTAIVFFMGKGPALLAENYPAVELPERFPCFMNRRPIWVMKDYPLCFLYGGAGAPHAADTVETLAALADYMLVEADGSRQMPLKAHAAHEPVIPACAERVICVAGASGFDRPIRACVHRPERFCALTGAAETDTVAPLLAAQAILTEGLCDTVFLNQVDNAELLGRVMPFLRTAAAGGLFTAAGSLQGDWGKRF